MFSEITVHRESSMNKKKTTTEYTRWSELSMKVYQQESAMDEAGNGLGKYLYVPCL